MPSPRILIVYPYGGIDTNPTMTFLLQSLADEKVSVDVLVPKSEHFLGPEIFGQTIHLKFLPYLLSAWQLCTWHPSVRVMLRLIRAAIRHDYSLRFDDTLFGLVEARRYSVIAGVDPYGIALAARLNRRARKPLVYISFEILFSDEVVSWDDQALKRMELAACERTSLALIQDEERANAFCCETSIPHEKVALVPVAPPPQKIIRSDFLRRTLEIPADRRIVLYCGNLEPWASRNELAEMVSYWSDKYCLVMHSHSKINVRMEQHLRRTMETGKVFVSDTPVPRTEMAGLVASADFGLAPYKPIPDSWMTAKNLYHLGFSSGKVSFYAMCGLPILARSLPVFEREFSRYTCGKVYNRIAETGHLLEEMDQSYPRYSEEARRYYEECLNPIGAMSRFRERLLSLAGRQLSTRA